jgi:hypothetical protein
MNVTIPTKKEIVKARTRAGGWTRKQLAEWGIPWPPPKGWRGKLEKKISSLEKHYEIYFQSALKRQLEFELTPDEFEKIVFKPCHYCGFQGERLNGVDRMNNMKGYLLSNCVSCCTPCNFAKGNHTYQEMILYITNIVKNRKELADCGTKTEMLEKFNAYHQDLTLPIRFDGRVFCLPRASCLPVNLKQDTHEFKINPMPGFKGCVICKLPKKLHHS